MFRDMRERYKRKKNIFLLCSQYISSHFIRDILRDIAAYIPCGSNYQSRKKKKKIKFDAIGLTILFAGLLGEYKVETDNRVADARYYFQIH